VVRHAEMAEGNETLFETRGGMGRAIMSNCYQYYSGSSLMRGAIVGVL